MTKRTLVFLGWMLAASAPIAAQDAVKAAKPSDNYDELLARYLETARGTAAPAPESSAWINGLMGDLRARNVNDLVTIRVDESLAASGSADSSLNKKSGANVGFANLFGLESKVPGSINLGSLVSGQASTDFKGAGATTRSGVLSAIVTARVAEVRPNGDLVIEGVREIDINGDRQIVVLTGLARVADILPGNVIPSAALGQFRIRYFGRGLIKDNLSPGWLVRVLNKIF
jgi:flagellar L-ring protein precursor FlgH